MTVGFDAKRLFHNKSGLGNYSRTTVRNLSHYYPVHRFQLYASSLSTTYPFFQSKKFSIISHQGQPSAWWRSRTMTKDWKKNKLSIYHGLSNELPFGNYHGVKTVVTIHDLIFKILPTTYSSIDRTIYNYKVRASCQRADKIIAISEQTKVDLIKHYAIPASKIKVIYPPVADLFYEFPDSPPIKPEYLPEQYILSVGSLVHRKNQLSLLKAWQLLDNKQQLPIVLVGKGKAYANELQQFARRHNMPVHFLSNITSDETLKAIYHHASLFVYPSFYEGFGLPILEALLCEVPVITSNVSAMPEAAGEHSILINPNSVEELANAIRQVLEDKQLQATMKNKGRMFAKQRFNPKLLTDELMEIYEGLSSNKGN